MKSLMQKIFMQNEMNFGLVMMIRNLLVFLCVGWCSRILSFVRRKVYRVYFHGKERFGIFKTVPDPSPLPQQKKKKKKKRYLMLET